MSFPTPDWHSEDMRALLDILFAPSSLGISFHDRELRFVYVNETLAAVGGRPVSAYVGRTFADVLPEVAPQVVPYLDTVLRTGEPLLDRRFGDDERCWLLSYYPVRNAAGALLGVGAVAREETERRRAERLLRESEERYRALVDMSPDAIVLIDDERLTFVNAATVRLIGASSASDLLGRSVWEFVHPDDAERAKREFAQALATRTYRPYEGRVTRLDGREVIVSIAAAVYAGGPAMQAVLRDVTERRAADREREGLMTELVIERGLLSTVLRQLPAGVIVLDAVSERVVLANEQAHRIWTGALAATPGVPVEFPTRLGLPGGRGIATADSPLIRAIREGAVTENLQTDLVCADGVVRTLRGSTAPVRGSDGAVLAAVATFADVTAEVRAQVELRSARDQLEVRVAERTASLAEANTCLRHEMTEREQAERQLRLAERLASVGTFAAGVAHEINNPLAAILATAELARALNSEGAGHEQVDAALRRIVDEAHRAGEIVKGLLRFAREEQTERWPVDVNQVVRRVRGLVAPEAMGVSRLRLRLARGLPNVVMNPTELEQVLVNLLRNAAQAGASEILLQTRARDDTVHLVVWDDGRGIAAADLDRIFDPFFTTRQANGGIGLGLSVVHGIVMRYAGTVQVRSRADSGTTFTVELPVRAAAPADGQETRQV